jgi:hypothetical protein
MAEDKRKRVEPDLMKHEPTVHFENKMPTRLSAAVFSLKVAILQRQRALHDMLSGAGCRRFPCAPAIASSSADAGDEPLITLAESATPLWRESDPLEHGLQLGKVHNLRTATRQLNGVEIPAGETFSFWAHVGKATKSRGYVDGRELREGCLIPTVGGGLCQLSNALYDAALKAGCEIVERHSHSQVVPGSVAEQGRDATIFWNYVDLRFRSRAKLRIEAHLSSDSLVVRFLGDGVAQQEDHAAAVQISAPAKAKNFLPLLAVPHLADPNSCVSCGVKDCFRYVEPPTKTVKGCTAYLVDEYWPEYDRYLCRSRTELDTVCLPIEGQKFHKANYAWTTDGFGTVHTAKLFTAKRSIESRKLANQGAARQQALLDQQRRLAGIYAGMLKYDIEHVVVSQGLLPFLWMDGVLGGRTFDVLMTALPMVRLHQRLDGAAAMHKGSITLGDFRADQSLLDAETEALRHARKIITPHSEIASMFSDKAEVLDWVLPDVPKQIQSALARRKVAFPAATVGRKGAFELRDAARQLNLSLILCGPQLEGDQFWQDVAVEHCSDGSWLNQAGLVVLPAFVENNPRRLLMAVAAGVPVIASAACGLQNVPGVITVSTGSLDALCSAMAGTLTAGSTI